MYNVADILFCWSRDGAILMEDMGEEMSYQPKIFKSSSQYQKVTPV
jgi:hypothetical protein